MEKVSGKGNENGRYQLDRHGQEGSGVRTGPGGEMFLSVAIHTCMFHPGMIYAKKKKKKLS